MINFLGTYVILDSEPSGKCIGYKMMHALR